MADPPQLPVSPPSTAKLRAQDLALLAEDARRFVVRDRPASDALWLALLKPRDVILEEYRTIMARWAEGAQRPNAGLLDPAGRPMGQGPSALECIAVATVAKAILGNEQCIATVMNRIEGTPTPRKLDETEAAESRATMIQGIEHLVRLMNNPRDPQAPGDNAVDVTPPKANGRANGKGNGHDGDSDEPGAGPEGRG